ncbi:hypothetical protein K439DRAFT_1614704 [Ramaria rubella]|nr:hypothetical protein K439DRAFT_1614704 [Ramaria rubella]
MPTPSPSPSPVKSAKAEPSTQHHTVKAEHVTPSLKGVDGYTNGNTLPLPSPTRTHSNLLSPSPAPGTPTLDARTTKAAEDPGFVVALQRQQDRELKQAELICSLENTDACLVCSGICLHMPVVQVGFSMYFCFV